MKVEFLADKGFCKKGEVHDLPELQVSDLVRRGIAKPFSDISAASKKTKSNKGDE